MVCWLRYLCSISSTEVCVSFASYYRIMAYCMSCVMLHDGFPCAKRRLGNLGILQWPVKCSSSSYQYSDCAVIFEGSWQLIQLLRSHAGWSWSSRTLGHRHVLTTGQQLSPLDVEWSGVTFKMVSLRAARDIDLWRLDCSELFWGTCEEHVCPFLTKLFVCLSV
jgi:hypothetical protein